MSLAVSRRTRLLLLSIALSCAFAVAPHAAAAQQPRIDCKNPVSTVETGFCLERELKQADAELNRVFQAAMASIDDSEEMEPAIRAEWKAALRNAQRAWIAFRDADCGEPVGYEWYGGTGMGGATLACLLEKTKARAKDLKDRYGAR